MKTDHAMIGSFIMRRTSLGWVVGRARERRIRGADTVEVLDKHHFGEKDGGLAVRVLLALGETEDGDMAAAIREFSGTATRETLSSLGLIIRAQRASLGWTQGRLAARARVSVRALREIERDRSDPKTSTVVALLYALRGGS